MGDTEATLLDALRLLDDALFDGTLPPVEVCVRRLRGGAVGRYNATEGITLNPDFLATATAEEALRCLAHEAAHALEFALGTAPPDGTHTPWLRALLLDAGIELVDIAEPGDPPWWRVESRTVPGGRFARLVASQLPKRT